MIRKDPATGNNTNPNISSYLIDELFQLSEPAKISDESAAFLGLLELQRTGIILGGKDQGQRTRLLAQWRILQEEEDARYWELINALGAQQNQQFAAARVEQAWVARPAKRTYLSLSKTHLEELFGADHILRELAARSNGRPKAEVRTGPFSTDNGNLFNTVVHALAQTERIRELPNGSVLALDTEEATAGYVEYLWRVYAFGMARCFESSATNFPTQRLASSLTGAGVGQGPNARTAGRASHVEKYARAFGIIDTVAENGQRKFWVNATNPVGLRLESAYSALYQLLKKQSSPIRDGDLRELMTQYDRGRTQPVFGWTRRDHHRLFRVLRQSGLLYLRDEQYSIRRHPWGDALTPGSL